jgi:hypothetical protein
LVLFCVASVDVLAQNRNQARAAMRAKSREMSKFTVKRNFGKSKQYASVGGYFGAANYFGDLAPSTTRLSTSMALTRTFFGAFYAKRINANFSWRASLAWARLRGDDFEANRTTPEGEFRYQRNLNFRNDVIELSGVAIADILPTDRGYLRRSFFNGYGLLGIAVFYHNPKGYVPANSGLPGAGTWIALQPLGTEGQGLPGYKKKYSLVQAAVILGGGVKYRVSDKLDLGLEFAWRFTFTDYLDDVSGNFVPDQYKDETGALAHDPNTPEGKLWYAMSNKSGFSTGGGSDERRDFKSDYPVSYEVLQTDGSWKASANSTPQDVRRIKGFGVHDITELNNEVKTLTGSPRGLSALDGYTITTLTASYIMEFRARTPKFR